MKKIYNTMNKKFTLITNMTRLLALIFLFSLSIQSWAVSSSNYSSLNGTSGSTLWSAVHSFTLSGYSSLGYDGLWTAYKTTDVYPTGHANAGKIWDMYGGCSFTYSSDQCGSYSGECSCYNREHSIPKSWWGGGTSNQGCDIFHVVPTDGKVNGMRSNYAFGEVSSATYSYNGSQLGSAKSITITNTMLGTSVTKNCSSSPVFEPIDEYKGDFARGYMGTLLHWTSVSMTQGDGSAMFSGTNTEAGHWGLTEYGIALLLKWHRQDPVSQKEIDRNNGIESTQGNRNPFIDYPILAEYIWGKYAGNTFNTSNAVGSFESAFTPGVSDGDKSSTTPTLAVSATSITMDPVAVNGTSTATFTVTGANLTSTISISVSGSYYSVSPTTITSANANKTNTITVTYHPTATGTHNGTITISSTGATSKSISVSGQCTTVYTATWMANGSAFHSNTAASGTSPSMPSDTPDDCSGGKVFVGWTAQNSVNGDAPSDLFTSSAPTISGNTTFYAVYADVTSSGTSTATFDASDITATPLNGTLAWTHTASGITLTLSAGQRYTNGTPNTFTVTKGESNYAQLSGNKTITQVEATISGTNYKINSVSPGTLSTSSTTQTITGINSTSLTMYATASYQIRLCSLVVSYSSISYNNYSTVCSTASSCTSAPTVGAASSSNVTTTSAAVNCSSGITSLGSTGCTISSYGFVYGTTSNPTVNSGTQVQVGASYTSTGNAFNTSLSGLSPNTTYYVRPYATNGYNTAYGTQTNFKTQALTQYTVTWHYSGGSTSVSYYSGESLALPTNPTTCDNGRVFKGWTTSSTYSGNGTDLMTSASGTVTANADYYAVYATASTSGGSATTKYTYNKVTSTDDIEDGDYLIVYEDGNVAFNGALSTLDAVSNTISITITNDSVTNFATVDAAKFTIATSDGSILSASGKYIGATSNSNTLNSGTTAYTNTLSIDNDGNFVCLSSGGAYLRYNPTSGQTRFRYYKSSSYTNQKAIQLYKKVGTTAGGGSSTTTYSDYSTSCSTFAYIVTWNATANGGTCTTATSEINAGDELGTLPTATKEGHSFDGWFTASTGGTKITTATIPTGDVEYFAQFTPNTYTITYNKGTNGTGTVASTSKTYGVDATLSESTFTREGYTQDGWSTTDGGDKVYDLGGTYTTNEATTLYPHWTALPTYTVTFKVGTGNHATFVGWAGKSISGINTPSACDGYTFVGWSTQQYGTTNTVAPAIDYTGLVPETNTTYYAVFSTNGAAVGSTLWAENFAHFVTNTPSAAGSGTGTNVYGDASITYAQSSDNTKAYDEILAGGSSPELLLNKSNSTWTIIGIPMANATAMSLTFLSNKTTFGVTTNETTKLEVNGSGKSWTISLVNGQTAPTTFNLIITNTGSQNARLDNVQLKVTAIEDKGAIFTTSKTFTITVNSENNTQGTVAIQ